MHKNEGSETAKYCTALQADDENCKRKTNIEEIAKVRTGMYLLNNQDNNNPIMVKRLKKINVRTLQNKGMTCMNT
jgi:hypothetical protein